MCLFRLAATPLVSLAISVTAGHAMVLKPSAESGKKGQVIQVDLSLNEIGDDSLMSFGLTLEYDPDHLSWKESVISPLGAAVSGTEEEPGKIVVTGMAPRSITSDGSLLRFDFNVTCTAPGSTSLLIVTNLTGDIETAETRDGTFECR